MICISTIKLQKYLQSTNSFQTIFIPNSGYYFKSKGGDPKAVYHNGIVTVLEGSLIAPTNAPKFKSKAKRNEMLANLTENIDGQCILKVNKDFTSPSTAATFVSGNNFNGWLVWKTAKGEPLDLKRNKE